MIDLFNYNARFQNVLIILELYENILIKSLREVKPMAMGHL